MSKVVAHFLLAGDMFMARLHLRKPGYSYSACVPFTTHRKRIQKLKERVILTKSIRTNQIKLGFLIMKHILIAKIWLRELIQITF